MLLFWVEEVLQQLGNLESDNSDQELTENEDEREVKINEPNLDNGSSSSGDNENEPLAQRIELNKDQITQLSHSGKRQKIWSFTWTI